MIHTRRIAALLDKAVARGSATFGAYAVAFFLFWFLRLYYWQTIEEEPFSDMADYVRIATRIVTDFSFSHSTFWQSYKMPTTPLLMAGVFAAVGEPDLGAWRFFQGLFVFAGLSWLLRETFVWTGRHYVGIGMALIVAICAPSIFWSYKPAAESLLEGFTYLLIAASLYSLRRLSVLSLVGTGALFAAAMLCRPTFLASFAAFLLILVLRVARSAIPQARMATLVLTFTAAFMVTWSPWLLRSLTLYGSVVPFSTQGPYSFLWEIQPVSITTPTGEILTRNVATLQREASTMFPNDQQASAHAQRFVRAWLADNWTDFPVLVLDRLRRQIVDRSIWLTKVPRQRLFRNSLQRLVLDKSGLWIVTGLIGLLGACVPLPRVPSDRAMPDVESADAPNQQLRRFPNAVVVGVIPVAAWTLSGFYLGLPRMAESFVPLFLSGNVLLLYTVERLVRFALGRRQPDNQTISDA